MGSKFQFILDLFFTLLIAGAIYTLAETYDDVLAECVNNSRNTTLCYAYNGLVDGDQMRFLRSCEPLSKADCNILLRAKALWSLVGSFDPEINLTIAAKFGMEARQKELRIEFGFSTFQPGHSTPHAVGIQGVRSVNGDLRVFLLQQDTPTVDVYQYFPQQIGRSGFELRGNETTLVLSYVLPYNAISVDGRRQHSYTSYEYAYIVAKYGGQWFPKGMLPNMQKEEIFSHREYAYAGCDEIQTRCLPLIESCNQNCLGSSSCPVLVRVTYMHPGAVTLHVRRQLSDQNPAYVSVGVSPTAGMDDTLVFDCMKYPATQITAELSYNDGRQNIRSPETETIPSYYRFGNHNYLECIWIISYNRPYSTRGFRMQFSNNAYHILMAVGEVMVNSRPLFAGNYKNKHTLTGSTNTQLVIRPGGITDAPGISTGHGGCLIPPPEQSTTNPTPVIVTLPTTTAIISTTTTTTTTITPTTFVSQTVGRASLPSTIDTGGSISALTTGPIITATPSNGVETTPLASTLTTAPAKSTPTTIENRHTGILPWIVTSVVLVILGLSTTWIMYKVFKRNERVENKDSRRTHKHAAPSYRTLSHYNSAAVRIGTPSSSSVPSHLSARPPSSAASKQRVAFGSLVPKRPSRATGHSATTGRPQISSPSVRSGRPHHTTPHHQSTARAHRVRPGS